MDPCTAIQKIWFSRRKSKRTPPCQLQGEFDGMRRRFEIVGRDAFRRNRSEEAIVLASLFLMVENGGVRPGGHDTMDVLASWQPKTRRRAT
jgi:hypothetical protein